jgi:predicted ATPase
MRIYGIVAHNYKSLRHLSFAPTALSVIVGANGSGKTNLADLFDFLSEVYRHGLDVAVARKGGYENIAHRKMRRSKQPISVSILAEMADQDLMGHGDPDRPAGTILVRHSFAFRARGQSIRSEFTVTSERLTMYVTHEGESAILADVVRSGQSLEVTGGNKDAIEALFKGVTPSRQLARNLDQLRFIAKQKDSVQSSELFAVGVGRFLPALRGFVSACSAIRTFQLSPVNSREYGIPIPRAELARSGANLPSVVDLLQTRFASTWAQIMDAMCRIMPGLERIEVGYTPNRTLGLYFHETGVGRPWTVAEISDGTIQALALLTAIHDPRSTFLVLEEPENSIHPWIIRNVLDACKEASSRKQVLLTTHSPVVLNGVEPESIWVLWRAGGESHLASMRKLDPEFRSLWESGKVGIFEYLDSGILTQTIPPTSAGDDYSLVDDSVLDAVDVTAPPGGEGSAWVSLSPHEQLIQSSPSKATEVAKRDSHSIQ